MRLLIIISILCQFAFGQYYDVIVVGSEPEGIAAATAAAESGARTLLVSQDPKLGGLFVMGQMNSLDLRTDPFNYQQGLFLRWWKEVGKGHSFDVIEAERAFTKMLTHAGVEVRLGAREIKPMLETFTIKGVQVDGQQILGNQIIDATAEMDLAAAAGAKFDVGFSGIGFHARMADTLVFRIDSINWKALKKGIQARGKTYASVDDHVAWGHFGNYPANYRAVEEGIRLRGLNLGLQNDGSVLVNALLIYGIDPFDQKSIAEGFARAEREAPRIVEYLKAEIPGFENAYYGGVADKLYIRETRHLKAECTLTVDHMLDNQVSENSIAAGGYPLDVQTLTPYDNGYVYGTPEIYGAELCINVPIGIDNLWVVGKAAGYDPIAASSARVVPFGITVAEAVGVAAHWAMVNNLTPRQIVYHQASIQHVRSTLLNRGAYLPEVKKRHPVGPYTHPYYLDYRLMLSRGLALGGYDNEPNLDEPMKSLSYVYLLSNVGQRFFSNDTFGRTLVARYPDNTLPLNREQALTITHDAACELGYCVEKSWAALAAYGLAPQNFPSGEVLTRGEMYALATRLTNTLLLSDTSRP
jgi:hypothetical protein